MSDPKASDNTAVSEAMLEAGSNAAKKYLARLPWGEDGTELALVVYKAMTNAQMESEKEMS